MVESTVAWLVSKAKVSRQSSEFAISDFVSNESPSKWNCVNNFVGEGIAVITNERSIQEANIEASIMRNDDGVTDEMAQGAKQ